MDGGAAQRSEGGGGGGASGEGQDEGGAVDIEMGDGDGGGGGRANEGGQERDLGDVLTPRNSKRATPEIELSKAVSKKQKNALPSDIEGIGGPPPTRKELVACVQDHVDNEEAVDSLREAISNLVNTQNLLHKLLDTKSETEGQLARNGGQVATPQSVNHEPFTLVTQYQPLSPHPQPSNFKPNRRGPPSCDTQDSQALDPKP